MHLYQLRSIIIFVLFYICNVWSGAIQITSSNIDSILSSNEGVFINFYANWCRFSQILNPIYDQLADQVQKEYSKKGLIVIGKVDCDSDPSISTKYHINKYPTLKFFRNTLPIKREYRGQREVEPLLDFIRQQIQSSIINISTPDDLNKLDLKKSFIIGHFDNENSDNYQTFVKVANLLRDECHFAASTNNLINYQQTTNDIVYYRSSQLSNDKNESYLGLLNNEQLFYIWANQKCIPLIRQITFENAEELTDEGLPFLILFHHIDDQQSVSLFQQQVQKQLIHEKSNINCLHADGDKFIHPLQHLGKTTKDLPLLVIDTFRHMFLFPDFKQISIDGKLLQFVKDLQSGKLHQDFHNPQPKKNVVSSPPESVFVRLGPSPRRYSFRDEL